VTTLDPIDPLTDDLDADVRRFVSETSAAYAAGGPFEALSIPDQRRLAETVRAPWRQGGPAMATTNELFVNTSHGAVRVRIYNPSLDHPKPALIYLHGGGWTLFSLETHDRVMREYAAAAEVVVIGVDYALSPEARFPVALEQVETVTDWLSDNASRHGVDAARIAVGGDSAGACLSMALALKLRDRGAASLIKAMLLIYPVFDTKISEAAARRYGGAGYMLSVAELDGFWGNYLRDKADAQNPFARPSLAEVAGLPPACLTIAECDILSEQGIAMAERLRQAGVAARADIYAGATHSFLEAVSISAAARKAINDGAAWLRSTLA